MRQTACAVTGHRPSRFKFKYSEDYSLCKKIKRAMFEQFKRLYDEQGVRRYYVGGALGVDMWAGELILRLKEQPGYGDIELVVVLPFEGHDAKWDERSKRRMDFLLRMCSECVGVWCMSARQARNAASPAITVLHRWFSAETAASFTGVSTGTTTVASPSSGAASAD